MLRRESLTPRRARALSEKGIIFLDVSTSGGIWGLEEGYCLMVDGDKSAFRRLEPIFQTLAPSCERGYENCVCPTQLWLGKSENPFQVVKRLSNRYNRIMEIKRLHGWLTDTAQAIQIQYQLAAKVSRKTEAINPRFIAGVDMSVRRGEQIATGAVVVLSYPELEVLETRVVRGSLDFPYVPGLLSFRELPLILAACEQLSITPDLVLVDGQGIAHPRRIGIASHLGLLLEIPTIGCAKSLLCGNHEAFGAKPGDYAERRDNGEIIGAALRTKAGVKPVYVSIGHKIDLPTAIHWVMKGCRGYRLPEPTRLAHQTAKGSLIKNNREAIGAGTKR